VAENDYSRLDEFHHYLSCGAGMEGSHMMAACSWSWPRIDGLEARGYQPRQFTLNVGRTIGNVVESGPVAGQETPCGGIRS